MPIKEEVPNRILTIDPPVPQVKRLQRSLEEGFIPSEKELQALRGKLSPTARFLFGNGPLTSRGALQGSSFLSRRAVA